MMMAPQDLMHVSQRTCIFSMRSDVTVIHYAWPQSCTSLPCKPFCSLVDRSPAESSNTVVDLGVEMSNANLLAKRARARRDAADAYFSRLKLPRSSNILQTAGALSESESQSRRSFTQHQSTTMHCTTTSSCLSSSVSPKAVLSGAAVVSDYRASLTAQASPFYRCSVHTHPRSFKVRRGDKLKLRMSSSNG